MVEGETGVPRPARAAAGAPFEPVDPARFSRDLAAAVNRLLADPALRARMGEAGRQRVEAHFTWSAIARRTADLYEQLAAARV